MKPYYTELKVTKISERQWRVLETWRTPYGSVPAGTVSNGANIPRVLWWLMSPAGILFEASIFHDCYYQNAWDSKSKTDKSFHKIALDYGTGKIQAYLAYLAVKWFGKGAY